MRNFCAKIEIYTHTRYVESDWLPILASYSQAHWLNAKCSTNAIIFAVSTKILAPKTPVSHWQSK